MSVEMQVHAANIKYGPLHSNGDQRATAYVPHACNQTSLVSVVSTGGHELLSYKHQLYIM